MLNDVMTLAEASVIWGIKYEGLLKCITAGPLDQPKFHDDEVDKIQDTWVVTRQAMERLFWPMRTITADTAYMLAQLECPGALITNYYETDRGFVFSGRWYGGGLPKVEKKTGRVGWYLEEWGNRDKAKWKATENLFMGSFEASLGLIYDSIKEKQEIVRKKQLPGVHNPYPESNNGMTAAEALKIAENHVGTKFHKYAESEDSFAFSIFRPGEVVYGPKSYIVSKSTGEVKQDPHKFFDPWPFGEWHVVTDDLRGKKNFIRRFLDKLKGSRP